MPAPDSVFVFIKISYKIFYNRLGQLVYTFAFVNRTMWRNDYIIAMGLTVKHKIIPFT